MVSNEAGPAVRLAEPGPKRLLALDGGGIRGLITLGFLERMEEMLRRQHADRSLVLSDYFDLIGGTSTGSIIASLLALGWPVADIRKAYLDFAREAFQPKRSLFGPLGRVLGAKFDEKPLEKLLLTNLGQRNLDSPDLKVGLLLVIKRADTGSVWAMCNLPRHRFFEMNRHMKLWELVRSSTAAPTFFRPAMVDDVGDGEQALFLDGGVSMHLNPALLLLMCATMEGFGLQWPLGEERMLLASVGTGSFGRGGDPAAMKKYSNLHWVAMLTTQLMRDSSELVQTMLQWMSASPTAKVIDRQIGSLAGDHLVDPPLLTYLRYDVDLAREDLRRVGREFSEEEVTSLRDMSNVKNVEQLDDIGGAAGGKYILPEHFPDRFRRGRTAA